MTGRSSAGHDLAPRRSEAWGGGGISAGPQPSPERAPPPCRNGPRTRGYVRLPRDGARAGMFGPDRAEGAVDVCGIRCGGGEKGGLRLDGEQAPRGLWVPRSSPRPLLESAGRLPGLPARRFVCGFRALGEGAHGAALRRTHQKVDDWIRGGAKSLDGIKDAHAQPKSRGGRSDKGQPRFSPRALRGLEKRTV